MPQVIIMPSLAAGMEEGQIAKWHKTAGDPITKGDVLVEIETDKAVMEVEAELDGVLATILVDEGDIAQVNDPIAELQGDGDAPKASEDASPIAPEVATGTENDLTGSIKDLERSSKASRPALPSAQRQIRHRAARQPTGQLSKFLLSPAVSLAVSVSNLNA